MTNMEHCTSKPSLPFDDPMGPVRTFKVVNDAIIRYKADWLNDTDMKHHLWQRANQQDAFIRFAYQCKLKWPNAPQVWSEFLNGTGPGDVGMISLNKTYISNSIKNADEWGLWTDDFGWAGMCCSTTSEYYQSADMVKKLGKDKALAEATDWCNMAIACLNRMIKLWDGSVLGNPVQHGISNTKCKNTVTNADFFTLCMQLYKLLKTYNYPGTDQDRKNALQWGWYQYQWFDQWFKINADKTNGIPYTYLHPCQDNNGFFVFLVEERPYTVATPGQNYTYDYVPPPKGEPGATWSGDQGLIIYGLSLFFNFIGDLTPVLGIDASIVKVATANSAYYIRGITSGILYILCPLNRPQAIFSGDGVFRETPFEIFFDTFNGDDENDYVAGRGVLCRLLNDAGTRQALTSLGFRPDAFTQNFTITAGAVADAQIIDQQPEHPELKPGQFLAEWAPKNGTLANRRFIAVWNSLANTNYGDVNSVWDKSGEPVFLNYCNMNGFDVLTAYMTSVVWPTPETNGEAYLNGEDGH